MKQERPVFLIANPVSGNGRGTKALHAAEKYLAARSIAHTLHRTTAPGDAAAFAGTIKGETPHIIVAGGDGTANEVLNGIGVNSDARLTLLSAGSGNDLARALGTYKKPVEEVLAAAFAAPGEQMEVGEITYSTADEAGVITRYFLSSCGIGFDAYVSWLSDKNNLLTGLPLYLTSVIKALGSYRAVQIEGESDGLAFAGDKLLITIGLTPTAGGGFRLTPDASINDGKLDLLTVDFLKPLRILTVLPKAIGGTHTAEPEVAYCKFLGASLKLKTPYFCQADGEILSKCLTGARFKVHAGALQVTRLY